MDLYGRCHPKVTAQQMRSIQTRPRVAAVSPPPIPIPPAAEGTEPAAACGGRASAVFVGTEGETTKCMRGEGADLTPRRVNSLEGRSGLCVEAGMGLQLGCGAHRVALLACYLKSRVWSPKDLSALVRTLQAGIRE